MTAVTEQQTVEYYCHGERIVGDLYLPAQRPCPAVVFSLGWGAQRGYEFVLDAAERLAAAGIGFLAFDFRGFGDSDGASRGNILPLEYAADVSASVAFLRAHPDIDPRRVSVMGMLTGSAAALYAASFDATIASVIALYPFGNGRRWLRGMRTAGEWSEFTARVDADRTQRALTGRSEAIDPDELLIRDPIASASEAARRERDPVRRAWRVELRSADALMACAPEDVVHRIYPRRVLSVGLVEDELMPFDEVRAVHSRLLGDANELLVVNGLQHHHLYTPERLDWLFDRFVEFLSSAWAEIVGTYLGDLP